ncbi:hypothetical protein BH23ACT9_BH23ACT9_03180 [soil metagenome]
MQMLSVMHQPVLVVSQKAKLIEVNNEYQILDGAGNKIGAIRQVGQSKLKKFVRVVSNVDQFLTHKLELTDAEGQVLLRLTRPAKIMKSTVVVEGPDGQEVGRIVQENMIGKIRFGMVAGGETIGTVNAENWRAWNFSIQDASGVEVGRVTKTFAGVAKELFTTADNYSVQIDPALPQGPLRTLAVAAAVTVDTALKQDS